MGLAHLFVQGMLWSCFLFTMYKASEMHAEWKALKANGHRDWVHAADAEAFCLVCAQIELGIAYFLYQTY